MEISGADDDFADATDEVLTARDGGRMRYSWQENQGRVAEING